MEEFWNCFAESIRYLLDHTKEEFWQYFRSLNLKPLEKDFFQIFPSLLDVRFGQIRRLTDQDMKQDIIDAFCRHMEKWREEGDLKSVVYCLFKFDYGLEAVLHTASGRKMIEPVSALNTNEGKTQIQLIARAECFWERNGRGKQHHFSMEGYLKNCIYIDLKEMGDLKIVHFCAQTDLFRFSRIRGRLRIGFSPVTAEESIQVIELSYGEERRFRVESTRNLGGRLCKIIEKAGQEKVDILLFPEMLGSEYALKTVQDYLKNKWIDIGSEQKYPDLLVMPTFWKDHRNVAFLLDQRGNVVFEQEKQYPYFMSGKNGDMREDIHPDRTIHLLHCEGLGRMLIMICKDFLEIDHLNRILKWLRPTIVLIPSFSTGFYDFDNMVNFCKPYDCHAIWLNTCAAAQIAGINKAANFDNIALTAIHGKRGYDIDGLREQRRKDLCPGDVDICKHVCLSWKDVKFE